MKQIRSVILLLLLSFSFGCIFSPTLALADTEGEEQVQLTESKETETEQKASEPAASPAAPTPNSTVATTTDNGSAGNGDEGNNGADNNLGENGDNQNSSNEDNGSTDGGTSSNDEPGTSDGSADSGVAGQDSDKAPINDGTYVIDSANNTQQVVDVKNGSKKDGANVQTYESNMSAAQKWEFIYNEESGYYTIRLAGTTKVLDVAYGKAQKGANVQIYESNNSKAQLWKLEKKGDAFFIISGLSDDLVLDIKSASKKNGANIQLWTKNGSKAQLFYLLSAIVSVAQGETIDEGSYTGHVGSQDSTQVIDLASGSKKNGANIQVYTSNGSASQKLYFKQAGSGFYRIYIEGSSKVLDAQNGSVVPGTNVRQMSYSGADAQKWALYKNADGSYRIVNKANGLSLSAASTTLENGVNIYVTVADADSVAQKFWLSPIANKAAGSADTSISGTFIIDSANNLQQVVDVKSGSTKNGANVQTYTSNMSAAQKWLFTLNSDGYYTIALSNKPNMVLDIASGSLSDAANVQIYASNGSDAQRWKLVKSGTKIGNYEAYYIVSKLRNDLVLDLKSAGKSNGTNVQVYTANASAAQKFYLLTTSPSVSNSANLAEGAYTISVQQKDGTYVIDIKSGSTSAGANAQLYTSNNSLAQRFYLKKNSDGFYNIINIGTGKALDALNANLAPKTNVQQWTYTNAKAQQWALEGDAQSGYSLINRATGQYLSVAGDNYANSSNVELYLVGTKFWFNAQNMVNDGLYAIAAYNKTSAVVDIKNGSSASGAAAQLYTSNNSLAQRFQVTFVKNDSDGAGIYLIRSVISGGYLAASDTGVIQRGNTKLTSVSDDNLDGWKLVWNGSYFSIQNLATASVITAADTKNATPLSLNTLSGSATQYFFLLPKSFAGLFEIHSKGQSGKNLDIASGSTSNGANVQVYKDNNSVAQKFYLEKSGAGYVIKNYKSGKYVSSTDGVTQQATSQVWLVEVADGGGIMFVSSSDSDVVLAATTSGNVAETTKLAYGSDGYDNQRWGLEVTAPIIVWKTVRGDLYGSNGNSNYKGWITVGNVSYHFGESNGKLIGISVGNTAISTYVSWMLGIAVDNSHGYTQDSDRWGQRGDYDCSSLVISAVKKAGLKTGSASYTGDMRSNLAANGFKWVKSLSNLKAGDILLAEVRGHTAVYLGNGYLVHARHNEFGGILGGTPGDQTGYEICVEKYYDNSWNGVLRLS